MEELDIPVRLLHPDACLPTRSHDGDAGADLTAVGEYTIEPGERAVIATGLALQLPTGYAAFVHPRSGLAARHGLTVLNAPGTIDAGFRGEVKVIVINTDRTERAEIRTGERIAQLVIQRVELAMFSARSDLEHSARAAGGFGSTGR